MSHVPAGDINPASGYQTCQVLLENTEPSEPNASTARAQTIIQAPVKSRSLARLGMPILIPG